MVRQPKSGYTLKQHFPFVSFGTSGVRALVADLSDDVLAASVRRLLFCVYGRWGN